MQRTSCHTLPLAALLAAWMVLPLAAQTPNPFEDPASDIQLAARPSSGTAARRATDGSSGFQTQMSARVRFTPEQRDAVSGLMAEQRKALRDLNQKNRADKAKVFDATNAKIRALLSDDQKQRFDAFLAERQNAAKKPARS